MKENKFQSNLINKLKTMFPECLVLKNDANYKQGIPDLLILYKDKWAVLECKRSSSASKQPLQDYYISLMDEMSFGAIIFPDNEEVVLNDLRNFFV